MEMEEYQNLAMRTDADQKDAMEQLENGIIGAANEFGELLGPLKKWKFQGHDLDLEALVEESGDGMWYVAQIGEALEKLCGMGLAEIAEHNVAKLEERYPEGFDSERSKNR